MKWNFNLRKSPATPKPKKSLVREWLDAFLFALVFSTIIRGLLFSAYAIPSGSMEGTELAGDHIFVSKLSYGARMPITPFALPFMEPTIGSNHTKTYWEGLQLPYFRLPGLGEVKKGEVVVFNKPARDEPPYERPIDQRITLIKRCQAVPGDVVVIKNGQVYVNGCIASNAALQQTTYLVTLDGQGLNPQLLQDMGITTDAQSGDNQYIMTVPASHLAELRAIPGVKAVAPYNQPAGEYNENVFPHSPLFKWNEDNYGPVTLPKQGMTIPLTESNLAFYHEAITRYEHNRLEKQGNVILLNGRPATAYTFKMGYYWMMGDNRHNSLDSRFWGYVPEDHIIGKAMVTWLSTDSAATDLLHSVRWSRTFKPIR